MTDTAALTWFESRTGGAPLALQRRAREYFAAAPGELEPRLAAAGQAALAEAGRGGAGRGAALDLLAADALITLAVLAAAEFRPDHLLDATVALRQPAAEVA